MKTLKFEKELRFEDIEQHITPNSVFYAENKKQYIEGFICSKIYAGRDPNIEQAYSLRRFNNFTYADDWSCYEQESVTLKGYIKYLDKYGFTITMFEDFISFAKYLVNK